MKIRLAIVAGLLGATDTPYHGENSAPKPPNTFKKVVIAEKRYDKALHIPIRDTSQGHV